MPEFDPRSYAYPSRRNVVYARKAMACTSIPQGAQIGLDVMKAGGNAVDAAVAMAAAMPLLEPTSNGLGSDCFALVWVEAEKKLYGLNASGVAPAALSAALVRELGHQTMPQAGWIPTMVPGAPAGWAELNRRFGTKPLPQLFAPAISAAREGVPVQVNLEPMWEEDARRIAAKVSRLVPKVSSTFVLSDLEYLYKGGRCSGVARFGANVLGIKPSIAVTPEGSLEVSKKYRGKIDSVYRQYVTDRLLDLKRMDTGRIVLADSGGVAPDTLAFLRGVISGKTGCKELILADAGCTISSHCGPGTLAVFYLQK